MPDIGRVGIGLSNIYVAQYTNAGGTISYTNGRRLGRAVDVSFNLEDASDNDFWADNVVAESAPSRFRGGTVDLEIDGTVETVEQFVFGLTTRPAVTVTGQQDPVQMYGDGEESNPPYMGIGFIVAEMAGGVTTYKPVILRKGRFQKSVRNAHTSEEDVDWQTHTLTAQLHRDDTVNKDWRWFGENVETEEIADAVLRNVLGITG